MENKRNLEIKKENYYKEIINNLRKEISELIKENENLRNRVVDLEIINQGHQELVGHLMAKNKEEHANEKQI